MCAVPSKEWHEEILLADKHSLKRLSHQAFGGISKLLNALTGRDRSWPPQKGYHAAYPFIINHIPVFQLLQHASLGTGILAAGSGKR